MGATAAGDHTDTSRSTAELDKILDDRRLTLAGLFFESWIGFSSRIERRLVAATGLTAQWFGLMLRIARSPGRRIRLSDLADQTGMSPSGLTRALDRLEATGLAERVACPSDRRGAFATLTAEGLDTLHTAAVAHLDHLDDILLSVLSPDDEAELARLLRKIRDHVNPDAGRQPQAVDDAPDPHQDTP